MSVDQITVAAVKNWPLSLATVLYVCQALICVQSHKPPQAIMFAGYALANVGILWALV